MSRVDGTSRDLDRLVQPTRLMFVEVGAHMAAAGYDLLIYCTWRSAAEQARIYRRSRTIEQISRKSGELRLRGYGALADLLMQVGPQWGRLGAHLTYAGPGESWHQYGEAADGVPLVGGKADWQADTPAYRAYRDACKITGLQHATQWKSWQEWPHAQRPKTSNPLDELEPNSRQVLELTEGWG